MTKICGYISAVDSREAIQRRLESMVRAMRHDPAAREEYVEIDGGGIGLVANPLLSDRLSAWNAERTSCLALCGHVVGLECGAAPGVDPGRLLQCYQERGERMLSTLNGVFVFVYYDVPTGLLKVVNDRYGFMPLYYCCDGRRLLFASEVKAILRVAGPRQFDWEAFADFFYVGHMLGDRTLFKQIHALGAGHTLAYRNGTLHKSQYHDFTSAPLRRKEDVSIERLAALFTQAVRRRARAELPGTVLLSGGFDSRLILGALHRAGAAPTAISLEHATGPSKGADARCAARLARELGTPCDYRQASPDFLASRASLESFYILDGMVPSWSVLIGALYSELDSRQGIIWDGLALDVALGCAHAGAPGVEANLKEFLAPRRLNRLLLRLALRPPVFRAVDATFMRRLRDEVAAVPASENQYPLFLLKHRTRRRIAVNPYQLFASRAEPMTPAADTDFMDYVLGIPSSVRRGHRLYVELLRREFPRLTSVPVISGGKPFHFDGPALGGRSRGGRLRGAVDRAARMIRLEHRRIHPRSRGALWAKVREGFRMRPIRVSSRDRSGSDPPASAGLVVAVLDQKGFDRPIYNTRLLRRLFSAYRRGNGLYHKLFEVVFYIELWHLLFVDQDSDMYFNPAGIDLPARAVAAATAPAVATPAARPIGPPARS